MEPAMLHSDIVNIYAPPNLEAALHGRARPSKHSSETVLLPAGQILSVAAR